MAGPFIDPGIMLLDPQFTDRFGLIQRIQSVSVDGVVSTSNTTLHNVLGVITPAKPAEMERHPEMEFGQRTLSIISRFKLNAAARNPATGQQRAPDQILWSGDLFTVLYCEPWTRYGAGWTKTLATSVDSIDAVTQGAIHAARN